METNLYNQGGDVVGKISLPDRIFGVAMNQELVKQVLDAQSANSRQVIAHTKDRAQVSGGGRKPWKQKGTGRARHASIRSPIWKGGGVAFGPTKERNFEKKINKKMKRQALFMVLSSKIKDREIILVDDLKFEQLKTKVGAATIKILSLKIDGYRTDKKRSDSVLVITPGQDKDFTRTINNLPHLSCLSAKSLNVKDLLLKKYLILFKNAIPIIEETFLS
ncbi:MAG: 50S ribosomal protein L4 [Patescibacteria group bacterium]